MVSSQFHFNGFFPNMLYFFILFLIFLRRLYLVTPTFIIEPVFESRLFSIEIFWKMNFNKKADPKMESALFFANNCTAFAILFLPSYMKTTVNNSFYRLSFCRFLPLRNMFFWQLNSLVYSWWFYSLKLFWILHF